MGIAIATESDIIIWHHQGKVKLGKTSKAITKNGKGHLESHSFKIRSQERIFCQQTQQEAIELRAHQAVSTTTCQVLECSLVNWPAWIAADSFERDEQEGTRGCQQKSRLTKIEYPDIGNRMKHFGTLAERERKWAESRKTWREIYVAGKCKKHLKRAWRAQLYLKLLNLFYVPESGDLKR